MENQIMKHVFWGEIIMYTLMFEDDILKSLWHEGFLWICLWISMVLVCAVYLMACDAICSSDFQKVGRVGRFWREQEEIVWIRWLISGRNIKNQWPIINLMSLEYVFYTSKVFEKIVFKSMKHPSSPFMIPGVFILPISESSCRCFSSRHQLANAFLLKFIQLHVNGQNGSHESPSWE